MIETILNILYITIISVLIIDISGFVNSIKTLLSKFLKCKPEQIRLKPFDCSLCTSFWLGVWFLYVRDVLTLLTLAILLAFACSTPIIKTIWIVFYDKIINLLNSI